MIKCSICRKEHWHTWRSCCPRCWFRKKFDRPAFLFFGSPIRKHMMFKNRISRERINSDNTTLIQNRLIRRHQAANMDSYLDMWELRGYRRIRYVGYSWYSQQAFKSLKGRRIDLAGSTIHQRYVRRDWANNYFRPQPGPQADAFAAIGRQQERFSTPPTEFIGMSWDTTIIDEIENDEKKKED